MASRLSSALAIAAALVVEAPPPRGGTPAAVASSVGADTLAQATGRPCSGPEYRQFDFWLGEWEVHANGKLAGHNRIESTLGGCALTEHWEGAAGGRGVSLNAYWRGDRRWHQTWVDAQGGRLDLAGAWNDATATMTMSGTSVDAQGAPVLNEIAWERRGDGTVRQRWRSSGDGGKTWRDVFDGTYRRKTAP